MAVKMMLVHALTSLHAGSGQGVGAIDMPIARERATELPFVPGSTLKGCLRGEDADNHPDAFGTVEKAGTAHFSDARLLLMPLRCLGASFVWAACPYVLRRFKRDVEVSGLKEPIPAIPDLADGQAQVATGDSLIKIGGKDRLVLEEIDFAVELKAADWSKFLGDLLFPSDEGWKKTFKSQFAILDDKSFSHLVKFGTEVNAHVKIDRESGVAKDGMLWYQESLPAETVLVSLVKVSTGADSFDGLLRERTLQIGGKASTGHGLVRFAMAGGAR